MSDILGTGCWFLAFAVIVTVIVGLIRKNNLGINFSDTLKKDHTENEPIRKDDIPVGTSTKEVLKEGVEALSGCLGGCLEPVSKFAMVIAAVFGVIYILVKFIKWVWYL